MRLMLTSILVSLFIILGLLIVPVTTYAATSSAEEACQGLSAVSPDGTCETKSGAESSIDRLLKVVLTMLSFIAGIIAVVMIIVSGFKYITSNGDSNSLSSSKKSLIYAIIGLVVVAISQFIVMFVINNVTKT